MLAQPDPITKDIRFCHCSLGWSIGDGTNSQRTLPVTPILESDTIQISLGRAHTLFLTSNGTVYATGDNSVWHSQFLMFSLGWNIGGWNNKLQNNTRSSSCPK
jgi:alpha-tubulin suppressor-like RCC1 family protein